MLEEETPKEIEITARVVTSGDLCRHHSGEKLIKGKSCQKCLDYRQNPERKEKRAVYLEDRRAALTADNLCPQHPTEPLMEGKIAWCLLCQEEYEKNKLNRVWLGNRAQYSKERYWELKACGICPNHRSSLFNSEGKCIACVEQEEKHKAYCKENGNCLNHPEIKAKKNSNYCKGCSDRFNELAKIRKKELRDTGFCPAHPSVKAEIGAVCLDCWFAGRTTSRLGRARHKDEVKNLFYVQNKLCAYTSVELIPGINASLDHIIPVSKGGAGDDPLNIQWVTIQVNRSKSDLTHLEYIELIYKIHNYTKKFTRNLVTHQFTNFDPDKVKCTEKKCKIKPAINSYCKRHWFETCSLNNFETRTYGLGLEWAFIQQDGLCYYTGAPLILGSPDTNFAASPDHSTPTSKGGSNDLSNVQWVSFRVNKLKQDMTDDEFFKFRECVIEKFDEFGGLK